VSKRLCAITLLALLSTGCAHEPKVNYVCQATLTNENGEFQASADSVQWRYAVADGMWAHLIQSHAWQSADSFRTHGFAEASTFPALVIRFDHRFSRNSWISEPPILSAAGEIRIGDRSQRQWVSNLDSAVYSEWRELLAADGDMEVMLFEASDRAVLQRGSIPRRALESIEPTLQRLSFQVAEMELDPSSRCTVIEEEKGIVIT
jgi:hypothetical protein